MKPFTFKTVCPAPDCGKPIEVEVCRGRPSWGEPPEVLAYGCAHVEKADKYDDELFIEAEEALWAAYEAAHEYSPER